MQGYHKPAHRRVQSADEQQWGHRIHGVRAAEPAAAAATMGCGGLKPTSEHILPTLLFFKKKKKKKAPFKEKSVRWSRHADDVILGFIPGTENEFPDFYVYVNSLNENLKLSLEYDLQAINFLDLRIYFHLQKNDWPRHHITCGQFSSPTAH